MEFDFPQLEALAKIVEYGSFGAAAKALRLSASATSERISNLETAVGVQLFDRSKRRTRLTPAGKLLAQRATGLIRQRERIYAELRALIGDARGSLLIGASTIPGEFLLPRLLAGFAREHPQVHVTVRIGDSASIISDLEEERVELGVVGGKIGGTKLRYEPLWKDRLIVVVPKGHRWFKRRKIRLEELDGEPFLMREPGSGTRRWIESALPKATLANLNIVVQLGSTNAIKEGVLHGLGISILSERAVRSELRSGSLATVTMAEQPSERSFLLVSNPRKSKSPLAAAAVDYFRRTDVN